MKTLTISQARRRLTALANEIVATGEPITVTRRGKPVFRIVPRIADSTNDVIEGHPLRQMQVQLASDFDAPCDDLWEALDP